jgi:hypothetical protein
VLHPDSRQLASRSGLGDTEVHVTNERLPDFFLRLWLLPELLRGLQQRLNRNGGARAPKEVEL